MKIKSLFLDKVESLPPAPLPNRIVKRFVVEGKIKDVVVLRKAK